MNGNFIILLTTAAVSSMGYLATYGAHAHYNAFLRFFVSLELGSTMTLAGFIYGAAVYARARDHYGMSEDRRIIPTMFGAFLGATSIWVIGMILSNHPIILTTLLVIIFRIEKVLLREAIRKMNGDE